MYKKFAPIYDLFMEHCDYDNWKHQVYEILDKNNVKNGELLDIGCGTGELLLKVCERFHSSGLDISEEMLKLARKKLQRYNVELYKENMVKFDLKKKFDVAIALFDTVNHILKYEDLVEHLKTVKKHLKQDGLYIFDVVNRKFMDEMFPSNYYVDKREKITIIWEHSNLGGIDCIESTYFIKNEDGNYTKSEEIYMKKIFSDLDIIEAIKAAELVFVDRIINKEIAGERSFFVLKNRD